MASAWFMDAIHSTGLIFERMTILAPIPLCTISFDHTVALRVVRSGGVVVGADDVGLKDAKVKPVPAKVSLKLHAFKEEPPFDLDFNYRSAVGKLNYLAQTTRPDIMYATHQVARTRDSHMEKPFSI